MDIRKLQRAIVDGLEDVKANDIQVFNTEHLSPLFERVIIASGTSNRQTKALATSVREAVKAKGMEVLRTEGGDNGEWIIVDCGPAVAHIMQPAIRQYYRLEEIWGEKPVRMKIDGGLRGLPKAAGAAAVDDAPGPAPRPAAGATGSAARKAAPKPGAKAAAKAAAKPAAPRPSGRRTGGARSAAGDSAPSAPRKRAAAPRSAAAVGSGGARTRPAAKAPRRG